MLTLDPLLQQLLNDGVDLDEPRQIDHYVVSKIPIFSALFTKRLVKELEDLGCTVKLMASGSIEASEQISPNAADGKKREMQSLCARYFHSYDFWGTSIDISPPTDRLASLCFRGARWWFR
jgi:regulator of RNase E activity RraB